MAKTKAEFMQSIRLLEKNLATQEKMRKKYADLGKDSLVKTIDGNISDLKDKIKALEKPTPAKPKKTISGSMTKEECNEMLEKMRSSYLKSKSTTKKNIKSGKAESDGSLKASASLKNEAETIENKSDAGQTINKKELKAIAFNIEKIVENCIEMIPFKKDADMLLKDLIRRLQELRGDISSGKVRPGSQN